VEAIGNHLNGLLHEGFIAEHSLQKLRNYSRYLTALNARLDKCQHNPAASNTLEAQWREASSSVETLAKQFSQRECWPEYLAMVEEFHVSLFAQHLKTPYPISLKRLEKFRQENFRG
jgi:ATP-dependent helicase HrpA